MTVASSPWFGDSEVVRSLPLWAQAYATYARFRGRDGLRALLIAQRTAKAFRLRTRSSVCLDQGVVVVLNLLDTRFPWVISEISGPSFHRLVMERYLGTNGLFIDAGANHGGFALTAARLVGDGGQVFAFEPNPILAELLTESAALNFFTHMDCRPVALGRRTGHATLRSGRNSGWASIVAQARGRATLTQVPVSTLDTELALGCDKELRDYAGGAVLKIDVEGGEVDLLHGAHQVLRSIAPVMLIEINPLALGEAGHRPADIVELLQRAGYDQFSDAVKFPDLVPADQIDCNRQFDLLAVASRARRNGEIDALS